MREITERDFQQMMTRSREKPVVVEFYAEGYPRCADLPKVLAEYGDRVEAAQVDLQRNQRLAMMLQVQSLPTVYVFRDGQPADGFQGDQPAEVIKQVLDRHVPAVELEPLEAAEQALAAGRSDLAERYYQQALHDNPSNGKALVGLARLALGRGATDEAAGFVDRVPEGDPEYDAAQRLKGVFGFAQDAGDVAALRQKVEANPKDAESWYRLGATYATQGEYEASCQAFLKVVSTDRELREDGGRAALLALFDLLGTEHPLVQTYRRRLAALLF